MDELKLRKAACRLNRALFVHGLAVATLGNASIYDAASGSIYIKPSGVDACRLRPEMIVRVDLETETAYESRYVPSVDLPHHIGLYRRMPEVRAIVHTHSNYATAFAACHRAIPTCLTEIADQFGGDIPCAPYISFEATNLADCILRYRTQAPAILLGNHGMFAWGTSPRDVLKTAQMVENAAKTVWLSLQIGRPVELPSEETARWNERYQSRYGQPKVAGRTEIDLACRTFPR